MLKGRVLEKSPVAMVTTDRDEEENKDYCKREATMFGEVTVAVAKPEHDRCALPLLMLSLAQMIQS